MHFSSYRIFGKIYDMEHIVNLPRGLQFNFNKRYKGRRFILAFLDVLFSPCLGLVLGHSKINRFWATKKIVTKKCIFVENMLSPK